MRPVTIDLHDPVGTFDEIAEWLGGRETARRWVDELALAARLRRPTLDHEDDAR